MGVSFIGKLKERLIRLLRRQEESDGFYIVFINPQLSEEDKKAVEEEVERLKKKYLFFEFN